MTTLIPVPTTMTISLATQFGSVLVGRTVAAEIRKRVEVAAQDTDEPVVLDFAAVLTISPSFADELFAKMSSDLRGSHKIKLVNMSPALESIARFVVAGRDD